jgi:CubicO group peptidase (beta-lactamase class C family)
LQVTRSKTVILVIALAISVAGVSPSVAGERSRRHAREIDRYMSRLADVERFNGAVLVVENGGVIYKNAFGYANFEWKTRNTTDTSFIVGSITKTFTAVLAMQLVEEGKIDLDDTINDYLPDYPEAQGGRVTIRHLLSNMSGIPNYVRDIPAMRATAPVFLAT